MTEKEHADPTKWLLPAAALLAFLVFRLLVMIALRYDAEELVSAHLAWQTKQGWRFLADDGEFAHSPLSRYLLLPFFYFLGESGLLPYRAAMSVVSLAALAFFLLFLRRLGATRRARLFGVLCLGVSLPFLTAAQQVGGVPFALLFTTSGLALLAGMDRSDRPGRRAFQAALLLALAAAVHPTAIPYLLCLIVPLRALTPIDSPNPRGRLLVMISGLFAGVALPFAVLAWFYRPILGDQPSLLMSPGANAGSIPMYRLFMGQPLFWAGGSALGFLLLFRRRSTTKPEAFARALLWAGLLSLLPAVLRPGGSSRYDLLFPALTIGALAAWAGDIWANNRPVKNHPVKIAVLLPTLLIMESLFAAYLQLWHPPAGREEAHRHLAELQTALAQLPEGNRPRQAFVLLYKLYDPFYEDDHLTRAEQAAGIAYFNRHVIKDETALAADFLNIFRPSPASWSFGPRLARGTDIETIFAMVQKMPPDLQQVLLCGGSGALFDQHSAGLEENLVRDLERHRPAVALIDRAMLDLWFQYPAYLDLFDRNYELRFASAARRYFAHRLAGPWQAANLPPATPLDCR